MTILNRKINTLALIIFTAIISVTPVAAQMPSFSSLDVKGTSANVGVHFGDVKTLKLASKLMRREMPYRVVLPSNYDAKGNNRYPVIYLLHGLWGHYTDWTNNTKLAEYAAQYNFIVVTPEGDDGWYVDNPTKPEDKYESYIVKELIPEIDSKFLTQADRGHRMIAGLSMGGYGSLKFGFKYPEMFSVVGSFSGALGTPEWGEKTILPAIGKKIDAVFGAVNSEVRYSNNIFRMARELTPEKIRSLPYVYLSCGTEDLLLINNNRDFLGLLNEKRVPHEYREHPGKHEWPFWDDQVREFLAVADRRMKH